MLMVLSNVIVHKIWRLLDMPFREFDLQYYFARTLFKSGHIRDFQVIWLTFIPFFLQNICLLHIIIITNNNYSISHQYNISNFHYHCLKVSIIILGSWSLLPECFIHCLHENQVDLPEYLLAFLAQKWKMAIWTNRGGGGSP